MVGDCKETVGESVNMRSCYCDQKCYTDKQTKQGKYEPVNYLSSHACPVVFNPEKLCACSNICHSHNEIT